MPIRQPIVCVLGHVDTGKTLLLDRIRKTTVQAREAGGITQHIGASFFPVETIKKLIGPLLSSLKGEIQIPGLLIVDTPGHEAFTNLRRRGGSVADIAILVVDILKGFEAQTLECIEILKAKKTPFIVAANKIDRIPGWKAQPSTPFLKSYSSQGKYVKEALDNKLYEIMGTFSRHGKNTDRFDKIKDFETTIALIPTSAKTGEGLNELLMVLVGLTQSYLKKRLKTTKGAAKGSVLEIKEEAGLGLTLNTIIYDGTLKKDDLIVIGGKEKPITTHIRAILVPKPLDEIRDPRDKFSSVNFVYAASGVKIVAPGLEGALAGAPLYAVPLGEKPEKYVKQVAEEIGKIKIDTEAKGIVLKADTLGSLEAISEILKQNDVKVKIADVGDVSKRDITEASVVKSFDSLLGVILAFNVKVLPDAEESALNIGVKIFREPIIYNLIDQYLDWLRSKRESRSEQEFEKLVKPGKIRVLPGYVFRRAKPAIFGVEILEGRIFKKYSLIRLEDGAVLGGVQQIQDKGKAVSKATKGMEVAISMEKPIFGRHIFEKDTLYVRIPEEDAKILLTKHSDNLTIDEQKLIQEYAEFMRKKTPFWAF